MGSLQPDFCVTSISAGTYKKLSLPCTVPPTTPEDSVLSASCVLDAESGGVNTEKVPARGPHILVGEPGVYHVRERSVLRGKPSTEGNWEVRQTKG